MYRQARTCANTHDSIAAHDKGVDILSTITVDPRTLLDTAPMSRPQMLAVLVAAALSVLDGFDVLSITFAAPAIAQDWGIGKASLGIVLSSGLAGMALGSLFLAPFADVTGRRRMVMIALVIMITGMLCSACSKSVLALVLWRVFTGVGIGTMVALITPLAIEFSNTRRRTLAVGALTIGYPLGGMLGGLAAAALLRTMEWPAVFLLGAVFGALLIPLIYWLLPETLSFLLERRDERSLDRVNRLLARFGHAALDVLPAPPPPRAKTSYQLIFAPEQRFATLQITVVNFLYAMTVYYYLSWLPQLVVDAGFTPATASTVAAVSNLGGIVGAVALGALACYFQLRLLLIFALFGMGLATTAFGFTPASLMLLTGIALITGMFMNAGIAALYTTIASGFATHMRATGTGFVIGIGRGGSAIAPAIAGALFAAGASRGEVSALLGCCAALAGILLLVPTRRAPTTAFATNSADV